MIHETLSYLLHCPSDTLKNNSEEIPYILELQDFIHPCEKKLLQKILNVGIKYHCIENFIKTAKNQQHLKFENSVIADEDGKTESGLYIKAFCQGLDDCLENYRKDIIKLEELYLQNYSINLTYILSRVEKYIILFDALKSIILMIQKDNIRGCQIIGKLRTYLESGTELVTEATQKIIRSVNVIFFRQLCNWIIYGELIDSYEEFFVCVDEDEIFSFEEDLDECQKTMDPTFEAFKKKQETKTSSIKRFYLKEELFPFNNAKHLAEKILFMGQIVTIVRNDPNTKYRDKRHFKYKRDIWEGKDVEYYRKIQALENKAFSMVELEETIEECRLKLAEYLWVIMIEEANLPEHFQLVRDYYGLGRGELFQQFIISTEKELKENTSASSVTNLNFIFKETAKKMYGENDKTHRRFEMRISDSYDKTCSDPWSSLEIYFEVEWPLQVIFHPSTLKLYNKLFCYLVRIKKTHIDLHKLWLLQTKGKRKINPAVWTLRNTLMFVVNNIQYYLQVDVIEAQLSILKESFKNASEFGDITRHHYVFLTNLLSKTFISTVNEEFKHQKKDKYALYETPALLLTDEDNLVYKVILQILQLCDKFCLFVMTWDDDFTETEIKQLEELKGESDTLIQVLLRVLYDLHEQASGHQLLQLLQRLDFNRWFSKKKDFNLTTNHV